MVLSDRSIGLRYPEWRGETGPASIDLHLGDDLRYWPTDVVRDPRTGQSDVWQPEPLQDGVWVLEPGVRYLGATVEPVAIPDDLAGQIAARSSWGRDGLAVICGPAGWIDPGFVGRIVLELSVMGSRLVVWPGARVCQLVLMELTTPAMQPYVGRYQNQSGVTPSRLHVEVA